jgi:hypothetical protein
MKRFAYYLALALGFGGGAILFAASLYAGWLFWTETFWAFVKVMGPVAVLGIIIVLSCNALFEYAEK